MKKNVFGVMLFTILSIAIASSAYALYYPTKFYTNRSWTYIYNGPLSTNYNCLGYATGSMYWEWPWSGNPTKSQVASYLKTKYGYKNYSWGTPLKPSIISYGTSGAIMHFSKIPNADLGDCYAKWGSLERFKHQSWNPYNVGSDSWGSFYGKAVETYNKLP